MTKKPNQFHTFDNVRHFNFHVLKVNLSINVPQNIRRERDNHSHDKHRQNNRHQEKEHNRPNVCQILCAHQCSPVIEHHVPNSRECNHVSRMQSPMWIPE